MNADKNDFIWLAIYGGLGISALVILRTIFVPSGSGDRKSPFEVWLEFSQKRAQEDLRAELEKYRIDRGLAHPAREPSRGEQGRESLE